MLTGGAYVQNSTFDANTILTADSDHTPAALTVPANSFVVRAAGSIDAIAVGEGYIVGRMVGGESRNCYNRASPLMAGESRRSGTGYHMRR